ncbi:PCYCGC motif-containing (lipo)protein [Sporosarcina highlanderae]|uniref:PCYCGC motif-containing (Lipo)protein n=1 Tax=Sporosarcina highlanderae TaxID=3035916 RepID=A0ABT8JMM5_9BACL|nr:PCYCGC motif-containing (lipo)protein [Sporosarcina highlanderae]MDN4606414.1 PCYCGC motif-containing (lipo)protein [Sporosarcina highlanderae]
MMKKLMPIMLILMLVLSACGDKAQHHDEKEKHLAVGHERHLPNGDLQEATESATVLPKFLEGKPEEMRLVYQVAASASDILEYMPCYCGCGESAGHGNNLNCFVDEIREDGSVIWDDHGTRCLVCLEIAVQSVQMKQEGKSMKEIREFIDEMYKEGYAEPTDTPMPA